MYGLLYELYGRGTVETSLCMSYLVDWMVDVYNANCRLSLLYDLLLIAMVEVQFETSLSDMDLTC